MSVFDMVSNQNQLEEARLNPLTNEALELFEKNLEIAGYVLLIVLAVIAISLIIAHKRGYKRTVPASVSVLVMSLAISSGCFYEWRMLKASADDANRIARANAIANTKVAPFPSIPYLPPQHEHQETISRDKVESLMGKPSTQSNIDLSCSSLGNGNANCTGTISNGR
jgi:hypothetical protein